MKCNLKFLFLALLLIFNTPVSAEISEKDFSAAMEKYMKTDDGQKLLGDTVQAYFQKLQQEQRLQAIKKEEEKMEEQFKNPVKIDIGNSPVKGPKDAKVTIFEFSDFECPYCKRGANIMDQVLEAYPKDVKLVFKNLPLSFHKNAKPAAIAALAAGKQGKYWEMHDKLFKNQRKLNQATYEKHAKDLGLDLEKFKADQKDPELSKQVDEDAKLASKHGITGTPGFFVNGVELKGAKPFPSFKKVIDRWLEKK